MHNLFMKCKIKINRSFPAILALLFFACLVCFCVIGMTSHANGKEFNIDAEMLPSGRNTYNVRLTIENTGEDWEGTVRLMVIGIDGSNISTNIDCAYDTAITLPKGSTKQFTVSVPKESFLYISEDVLVTLLNKNMEVDAFWLFQKVFPVYDDIHLYSVVLDHKFGTSYTIHRLLSVIGDGSNDMSFGVLKFIVIVYVIIIGPILYMLLRSKKKRDLYWAAVPAAALVGVLLVFFAGRGFAVDSTRVYSVTVYSLSDKNDCKTYLHCYDAGHEEWSLRLTKGYEYIGPKLCRMYSVSDYDKYYYHVTKEGDRLFFGIKPNSGFEDGYFCAGRTTDVPDTVGSIEISQLTGKLYNISGTVTNNTDCDFKYFAVLEDESVKVYKGIPTGGTSSLSEDEMLFFTESITTIYDFSYIDEARKYAEIEDTDAIAALGVGVCLAYEQAAPDEIAVIGVVTDWDKAVDDDCSEVSYACFYTLYK